MAIPATALAVCVSSSSIAMAGQRAQHTESLAPIRGVVRAFHQAAISIDLPVRVAKLHFREAEAFGKGDRLVTFDCRRIAAEHAAAAAQSREMKLNFESLSYLDKRGATGRFDVEVAKVRLEKAEAEVASIAARMDQCVVIAPFAGRITELKINEHEVPASGQPFMSILDESRFEIDLIFPSSALQSLEVGAAFDFRVDETQRAYPARVLRIGAAVDPVSQSVRVIGEFVGASDRVLAGMSGTAIVGKRELAQ